MVKSFKMFLESQGSAQAMAKAAFKAFTIGGNVFYRGIKMPSRFTESGELSVSIPPWASESFVATTNHEAFDILAMKMVTQKERKPKDTPTAFHDLVDVAMHSEFGEKFRSSAIFCTTKLTQANDYGHVGIFSPSGEYSTLHSPIIADLWTDVIANVLDRYSIRNSIERYFQTTSKFSKPEELFIEALKADTVEQFFKNLHLSKWLDQKSLTTSRAISAWILKSVVEKADLDEEVRELILNPKSWDNRTFYEFLSAYYYIKLKVYSESVIQEAIADNVVDKIYSHLETADFIGTSDEPSPIASAILQSIVGSYLKNNHKDSTAVGVELMVVCDSYWLFVPIEKTKNDLLSPLRYTDISQYEDEIIAAVLSL